MIELKKNCPDAKVILDLSGVENLTEIQKEAFEGNSSYFTDNLVGVVLPDTVISIGEISFCGCGITEISIPASVKSIESLAFSNCKNLANVKLPDGLASIGGLAFGGCSGLKSIVIPDSVTKIDLFVFSECISLANVVIGSGITEIPVEMFYGCISLETVHIPVSVKKINAGAFACYNEKSFTVKYAGTLEQWNSINVIKEASSNTGSPYHGVTNDALLKATIHCSDGDIIPTTGE